MIRCDTKKDLELFDEYVHGYYKSKELQQENNQLKQQITMLRDNEEYWKNRSNTLETLFLNKVKGDKNE